MRKVTKILVVFNISLFFSVLSISFATEPMPPKEKSFEIFVAGKKYHTLGEYKEKQQKALLEKDLGQKSLEKSSQASIPPSMENPMDRPKEALSKFIVDLEDPNLQEVDSEKLKSLLEDLKKGDFYTSLVEENKPLDKAVIKGKLEELLKGLESTAANDMTKDSLNKSNQKIDSSSEENPVLSAGQTAQSGQEKGDLLVPNREPVGTVKSSWTVEKVDKRSLRR